MAVLLHWVSMILGMGGLLAAIGAIDKAVDADWVGAVIGAVAAAFFFAGTIDLMRREERR